MKPGEALAHLDERLRTWRPRGPRTLQVPPLPSPGLGSSRRISLFLCSFARVQAHNRTQQPSLDRKF